MKTKFEKWFDSELKKYIDADRRLDKAVLYLVAKKAWNSAIKRCWNIVKHYDDDTNLKDNLNDLMK